MSGRNGGYYTPDQLRNWYQTRSPQERQRPTRFLINYEIIGANESGLDLIEKLGIAAEAALVTSRYEEPAIRARCEALSLQVLPKALAGFVSITIEARTSTPLFDAVLLDDDSLVHNNWKMVARVKQKDPQNLHRARSTDGGPGTSPWPQVTNRRVS